MGKAEVVEIEQTGHGLLREGQIPLQLSCEGVVLMKDLLEELNVRKASHKRPKPNNGRTRRETGCTLKESRRSASNGNTLARAND